MMENERILNDLKQKLNEQYADVVKNVVLFGSQANRKAHEFSDWDILILLNKDYHCCPVNRNICGFRVLIN